MWTATWNGLPGSNAAVSASSTVSVISFPRSSFCAEDFDNRSASKDRQTARTRERERIGIKGIFREVTRADGEFQHCCGAIVCKRNADNPVRMTVRRAFAPSQKMPDTADRIVRVTSPR